MTMILHHAMPKDMTDPRALPGVQPVKGAWLCVDDAYGGQMARRAALLDGQREQVLWYGKDALEPAQELLDEVLGMLPEFGFVIDCAHVACPDGRRVKVDRADPLGTLGHLVQCDFCLLDKRRSEHVLQAAVLCFPASWMLSEKAGRCLATIHDPVAEYDDGLARRVQRLFDGVRVGQPLWRFNRLGYTDAELFQPRSALERRDAVPVNAPFIRSERQTILRLAVSGWVVFAIHTYVVAQKA